MVRFGCGLGVETVSRFQLTVLLWGKGFLGMSVQSQHSRVSWLWQFQFCFRFLECCSNWFPVPIRFPGCSVGVPQCLDRRKTRVFKIESTRSETRDFKTQRCV